jgi:hypothetical protein
MVAVRNFQLAFNLTLITKGRSMKFCMMIINITTNYIKYCSQVSNYKHGTSAELEVILKKSLMYTESLFM